MLHLKSMPKKDDTRCYGVQEAQGSQEKERVSEEVALPIGRVLKLTIFSPGNDVMRLLASVRHSENEILTLEIKRNKLSNESQCQNKKGCFQYKLAI